MVQSNAEHALDEEHALLLRTLCGLVKSENQSAA